MLQKKYRSLTLILIVFCLVVSAQENTSKKQLKKYLKEGQVAFYQEDHLAAWRSYNHVLRIDPKNEVASVNGAICGFKLKYPLDSVRSFSQNLAVSKSPEAKFYLARIRHQERAFDQAIGLFEDYLKIPAGDRINSDEETNYFIAVCKNARELISKPLRSIIKNMGGEINSAADDYVPVIMPDESALYFTSRRDGSLGGKKDETGKFYEDVYVSYKYKGQWQRAQNAGAPINSETNDACVALSPDGQRMIIYRMAQDGLTGDLYICKLGKDNKWSNPEKIGVEVNSPDVETSACFSNDTSEIYFSSNRAGGLGGKDIYRVKKAPDGRWAMPFNLGPTVNTSRDDDAPFLHPDGVTLYFSSQGHSTMGEFDVFKCVLDPETNQFSPAENLGFPINDVGNDIFFTLSVDGQRGYYSSIKNESFGGNDIYQVDTRFGENDLAVKKGKVLIDDVPGRVRITLMDNENKVNGNYFSDASTGKFILVMNPLKSYKAIVETDGADPLVIELTPMAFDRTNEDLEFKIERK